MNPVDFDRLFDAFYPALVRYGHRVTGDVALAEGAAQEAFVHYLERRPRGDAAGLRACFYRVTTQQLRDRMLNDTVREGRLGSDGRRGNPGGDRRIALVQEAMAALDPGDRILLLLREEGFSYRELAEVAGGQAASVGLRLARARRQFVQRLSAEVPYPSSPPGPSAPPGPSSP